jgi:hypothetical protein
MDCHDGIEHCFSLADSRTEAAALADAFVFQLHDARVRLRIGVAGCVEDRNYTRSRRVESAAKFAATIHYKSISTSA